MKMLVLAVWLLVALFGALDIVVTASPVLGPEDLTIVTHMWAGAADSFGPHALSINEAYAARHGHRLEVVRGDRHAGQRDSRWTKVSVLRELLDVGAGDKGAVLWMDSDAIFSNFNFSVLELVQDMLEGGSHIAVCKDLSAPKEASRSTCPPPCLNTGTMIVRRSPWSREFLRAWWEAAERDGLGAFRQGRDHEESVLAAMFKNNELQVRNKTLVLSPAQLNSIPPYFKDHNPEQAVMHLSDTPNAVRERVLGRLASGLHVIEDRDDRKLTTLHLPSDLEAISMEAFQEAWHSGSTDVRVALALSAAARDGGDQDEWLRLLEAALGLAPHDPDVVLAFASALAAVSHWCQAAGIFLKAARLVPESEQTANMVRNAQQRCAESKKHASRIDKVRTYSAWVVVAGGIALWVRHRFSVASRPGDSRNKHQ